MVKCSEYAYSNPNANLTNPISVHTYGYAMSGFGDLLTSYDNVSFAYDNIGNPTSYYNGNQYYFVWSGRQMVNAFFNSTFYTMSYDDNGVRQSKIVAGGVETYYIYDGTQLISEYNSLGELILYLYDATGSVIGMQYRDATYMPNVWDVYWFDKNPQGDVVGIFNTEGVLLVKYSYDAWGSFTTTYYNGGENTSATKNNITYRGYYYDRDFGLYYLITRYYDPVVKRFINADCYVSTGMGFIGYNMFAYCNNNPVFQSDPKGTWTFSINLGFFIGLGGGYSFSIGLSVDSEEMAAFTASYSVPNDEKTRNTVIGGTAGGSVSMQITDFDSVEELSGASKSGGINTPIGSFDVVYDKANNCHGYAIGIGPGVGGDYHVNETQTFIIGSAFQSLFAFLKGIIFG